MRMMEIIEIYGKYIPTEKDISVPDARTIIQCSRTKMEIAGNSYLYGYMNGKRNSEKEIKHVPLYNIPMMSDEEWNRMADQSRKERLVI